MFIRIVARNHWVYKINGVTKQNNYYPMKKSKYKLFVLNRYLTAKFQTLYSLETKQKY